MPLHERLERNITSWVESYWERRCTLLRAFDGASQAERENRLDDIRLSVSNMVRDCCDNRSIMLVRNIFHAAGEERPLGRIILDHRMAIARRLLAETLLEVAEIAARIGCASPKHFRTTFKKLNGVSPAAYRAAARRGCK